MTRLHHIAWLALLLPACSNPTPKASAGPPEETTPDARTSTSPSEQKAPASSPSSAPDLRAVLLASGCPPDKITKTGCSVCPSKLRGAEFPEGSVRAMSVRFGVFGPSKQQSALVRYSGCSSRAGGEHQITMLEAGPAGWSEAAGDGLGYNDTGECVDLKAKDGRVHLFCTVQSGSQGCYTASLETPNFHKFKLDHDTWPSPPDDCTNASMKIDAVRDLDGDGDQDMLVTMISAKKSFDPQSSAAPTMYKTTYKVLQDEGAFRAVVVTAAAPVPSRKGP